MSVFSLLLPIILCAIALFIASFLSWMVLQLHRKDWAKIEGEYDLLESVKSLELPPGSYQFPYCSVEEMKSEEMKQKMKNNPNGIITVFRDTPMGKRMALTFAYFLGVSFCLGYIGTLALAPGDGFADVFRVITTTGIIVFLAAIVQHSIWFECRIKGHIIESIGYAVIAGLIFGAMWPGA